MISRNPHDQLPLISNLIVILLREWRQCRRLTHRAIRVVSTILIGVVLLLTYGNYIRIQ